MIQGTGIKLKGVTFNNPALPKLLDYKSLIADNASCIAAFRFDIDELVTENGEGKITRIDSWKGGSIHFGVGGGTVLAAREHSDELDGKVARFTGAVGYSLNGYTFDPRNDYTILAVMKPDSYASENYVAGNYGANSTQRCVITSRTVSGSSVIAHYHGGAAPVAVVPNPSKFVAALARYSQSSLSTKVRTLDGVDTASIRAEEITGAVPFVLSSINIPFVGLLDFIALFDSDIDQDATLKSNIERYLRLRTGES